jgi:hypothetical protein
MLAAFLVTFLATRLITRAIRRGGGPVGVIGVFLPVVSVVGAVRLARPRSPWARRRYPPGSGRRRRSHARFPTGRRTRWDALVDLFAEVPPPHRPGVVGAPDRER